MSLHTVSVGGLGVCGINGVAAFSQLNRYSQRWTGVTNAAKRPVTTSGNVMHTGLSFRSNGRKRVLMDVKWCGLLAVRLDTQSRCFCCLSR